MKVANITLHAINNYGSIFQSYATVEIFKSLGCKVETIDYIRETARLDTPWKIITSKSLNAKLKIKTLITHFLPSKGNRSAIMEEFRRKHLNLTEEKYRSDADFEKKYPEADIYCTGSDQTWNTICQGDIPKPYFLHFVPDNKRKISFSASFGIEKLPEKDKPEVKRLLSRYDAISVRELSGINILKDLGIKGTLVLDPTLTVSPDMWKEMAAPRMIEEDYILSYQLNRSNQYTKYLKKCAQTLHLKVIHIRARKDTTFENGICMTSPSPEELLSLFKHAKYVLTDSFHATAFSTIFHRDFMVILPPRFSSRITDFLAMIDQRQRIVTDFHNYSYYNTKVDFSIVDNIINKKREETMRFLERAIRMDKNYTS